MSDTIDGVHVITDREPPIRRLSPNEPPPLTMPSPSGASPRSASPRSATPRGVRPLAADPGETLAEAHWFGGTLDDEDRPPRPVAVPNTAVWVAIGGWVAVGVGLAAWLFLNQ